MAVPKAAARGAFILFEGVDRCGKTTQSTKLVESLKAAGVNAELWRYPDRTTEMGKMINAYLQSSLDMDDGAIHLLFSANRWEKRAAMEKALSDGVTLVVDRYSYSGVAFTAGKNVPGLDLDWGGHRYAASAQLTRGSSPGTTFRARPPSFSCDANRAVGTRGF